MNNFEKSWEFCNIFSIIFLADNEYQSKISKIIVCPKNIEVEYLILEKFSRVLSVEYIAKIGNGIRSRHENNEYVTIKKGEKIRIETYWNDADLSSLLYENNNDAVQEFDYFVISISELDKKVLISNIEQNFNEIKSIVHISDDFEVLSLKV